MQKLHKSGFTLIELLIVTVVVVSLMAIVFRLTGIAGSSKATQRTIARMQRLENCLSGYYAAFGSYPPVPLQGASRDIYRKAMGNGVQSDTDTESSLKWPSVRAACLAQPVKTLYPVAGKKPGTNKDGFDEYVLGLSAGYQVNDATQVVVYGEYTFDEAHAQSQNGTDVKAELGVRLNVQF